MCAQAWLRVALGFHTVPQVVAGAALGAATAAAWHRLFAAAVLPALARRPELARALQGHGGAHDGCVCLAACAAVGKAVLSGNLLLRLCHSLSRVGDTTFLVVVSLNLALEWKGVSVLTLSLIQLCSDCCN